MIKAVFLQGERRDYGDQQKAHIDKSKCVDCGLCSKACPYNAITNHKRPCQNACKADAVKMDENKAALIDNHNCISCGACVYQCPFGAIMDKSFILNVIDIIKKSEGNTKYKVYPKRPFYPNSYWYSGRQPMMRSFEKCLYSLGPSPNASRNNLIITRGFVF